MGGQDENACLFYSWPLFCRREKATGLLGPPTTHLPYRSNLLSRQPRLRKAAADTLRHLAERDARAVLAERVETALFAALDGETGGLVGGGR